MFAYGRIEKEESVFVLPHNLDLDDATRIEVQKTQGFLFAYGKYLPFGSRMRKVGGLWVGNGVQGTAYTGRACSDQESRWGPMEGAGTLHTRVGVALGNGRTERRAYREDGSSPWGGNACLQHLEGPSLRRKTQYLAKISSASSVDKPVEPTVLYVLPSQSAMTMKTKDQRALHIRPGLNKTLWTFQ